MKFSINIDCTPDEARAFMGLPDVRPLQDEMLAKMRETMLNNLQMSGPDTVMGMWNTLMNQGVQQGMTGLQEVFGKMMAESGVAPQKK